MITTLTILSLHQGRIYSPPPEPVADLMTVASEEPVAVTKHHWHWSSALSGLQALVRLLSPAFGSSRFGKAH